MIPEGGEAMAAIAMSRWEEVDGNSGEGRQLTCTGEAQGRLCGHTGI